jgi:hypothetical protein
MIADHKTPAVLAVVGLATVIRSAFGFGKALVAVPLLAFIIPVEAAAPLAVLVSVTVAGPVAILLVLDWLSRSVVADRPGTFSPRVPTVGKWDSELARIECTIGLAHLVRGHRDE